MVKALQEILDGLYTMVNESRKVQMHQNFTAEGKNDGTIAVSLTGIADTAFRFSFATQGNKLMYSVWRGKSIRDKIIPSTVIEDSSPMAVERCLEQLTELLENLENGVPL